MMHSFLDCVTAVNVSVKDQLTLSSAVAIGSTIVSSCFCIADAESHIPSIDRAWAATFTLRHSLHRYRCMDDEIPLGITL